MKYILRTLLFAAAIALLLVLPGCVGSHPSAAPAIQATGSDVNQAQAHIQSAESDIQAVLPDANSPDKTVLNLASGEHTRALNSLAQAGNDLALAAKEADALAQQNTELTAANQKLLNAWGHKLQVFVTWAFWILVVLVVFHVVGGLATPFLPPPWNVGVGLAAKIVNPFGWITWLATNATANASAAKPA